MKKSILLGSIGLLLTLVIGCQNNEIISPTQTTSAIGTSNTPSNTLNTITNQSIAPALSNLNTATAKPSASDGDCQVRLQGTWVLTDVLDNEGNSTSCDMIYAHLPDTLSFTYNHNIRLNWIDATGFHLLDYTPNIPHECYHGMYQVNCTDYLLDVAALYCSDPSPLAARCGPPQYGRFRIFRLSNNVLILDSYEVGWSAVDYYPIPPEYIQRYIFEKV